MASLAQVLESVRLLVNTAVAGLSPVPEVAVGWPPMNRLQQVGQGAAGPAISVYDRKTVRNTTRWLTEVVAETLVAAGVVSVVSAPFVSALGLPTITLTGTVGNGDAVSCVLTRYSALGGAPVVAADIAVALDALQTPATMAAALATQINADPVASQWVSAAAVGGVVTLTPLFATGTLGIQSNTGNGGTQLREIGRRERQLQVVLWAQTSSQRDAIAEAISQATALADVNFGTTLPDGTVVRLTYGSDFDLEDNTLQDVYRHDFLLSAEYGVTTLDHLFAVLAPVSGLVIETDLD